MSRNATTGHFRRAGVRTGHQFLGAAAAPGSWSSAFGQGTRQECTGAAFRRETIPRALQIRHPSIIFIARSLCDTKGRDPSMRGDNVRKNTWQKYAMLALMSFPILGLANCGGSSSGSSGGSGGGAGGASAGGYLWEFSLIDGDLFFATIDSSTGQLGAPTSSGGEACNSLGTIPSIAVTPSDRFVFVIDKCFTGIHVYSVNGPGIALTEISESPYELPEDIDSIVIDPSGKFLYAVGMGQGTILQFDVNATSGELTLLSTTMVSADIRQVITDPHGKFIFVNDLTGGHVYAYLIGGGSSLAAVPGSPFVVPANGQPISLTMDGTGSFLYAPLISGGIAGFGVNGSTGALSDLGGSPFVTSEQPFTLAADSSGKYLYAIDAVSSNAIEVFGIGGATGALTAINGSPFTTPAALNSLAIDPSGKFVYATVNTTTLADSSILGFAIDASNGSISALPTSPYLAAPFPVDVVSLNVP